MYAPPTTLVLSGAGSNAAMQLGALWALEKYLAYTKSSSIFDHFVRYRGVSAGAFVVTMLSVGVQLEDICATMHQGLDGILATNVSLKDSFNRRGLGTVCTFRKLLEKHVGKKETFQNLF